MRKLVLLLIICTGKVCLATPSISEVRLLHEKAATSEKNCKELIRILDSFTEKNEPVLAGYKASATMMMAKFTFNPFSKFSYFKKGRKMLETAIEANKSNVELRFLRFAIQTNVPSFLGYDTWIEADKTFLLDKTPELADMTLKKMIVDYLAGSGKLTTGEQKKLQ